MEYSDPTLLNNVVETDLNNHKISIITSDTALIANYTITLGVKDETRDYNMTFKLVINPEGYCETKIITVPTIGDATYQVYDLTKIIDHGEFTSAPSTCILMYTISASLSNGSALPTFI